MEIELIIKKILTSLKTVKGIEAIVLGGWVHGLMVEGGCV